MKKTVAAVLCLVFLFCLCGCGSPSAGQASVQPTVPVPIETVPAPAVPTPLPGTTDEEQLSLILSNSSLWLVPADPYSESYSYAVTDLDHNGRLELFEAVTQGTGIFTYGTLYEVNSSFSALEEHPIEEREGYSIPEVTISPVTCYRDTAGTYYYLFRDDARSGMSEHYSALVSFSLKNEKITTAVLAFEYTSIENGQAVTVYRDVHDNTILQAQYESAEADAFAGTEKSSVSLGWFREADGTLPELLSQSLKVFRGELDAMPLPASSDGTAAQSAPVPLTIPVVTPGAAAQAAQIPDLVYPSQVQMYASHSGGITVTKNPSGESLAIGGKTWFIAHAENADALTWQLTDSNGTVYSVSEAMSANPGLSLEVLEGDTIAVSNVPLSLNGWSVQAVFSNSTNSAVTSPAPIFVGDFLSAYAPVIDKYKNVYASGEMITQAVADMYGVSEMAGYSSQAGYALKDLDKDGIPELIIAGTGGNNYSDGIVFEICTLSGNLPVQLCVSSARARYSLLSDCSVYLSGSNGASSSSDEVYKLQNGTLVLSEYIRSAPGADGASVLWSCSSSGSPESVIGEQDALARISALEGSRYLPFLTVIQ